MTGQLRHRHLRRRAGDVLAAFWKDHGWTVLALATVATVVLGFVGFTTYGSSQGLDWTVSTRLYLTLQLFAVNSGGVEGPIPPSLEVARFLAPLVLATAAIGALLTALQASSARWRARSLRDHVIVVGLGRKGLLLAERLHRDGRDVVVLERDPSCPQLPTARRSGIPVLLDDGTDPQALRSAGLDRADHLISVAGPPASNAAVAHAVLEAQRAGGERRNGPLRSFIEIDDLPAMLDLQTAGDHERVRMRQEFFNIDERGARIVLDRLPDLAAAREPSPTLVVVGGGETAYGIVVEATRRWDVVRTERTGTAAPALPILLAVPTPDADPDRILTSLRDRHPKIGRPEGGAGVAAAVTVRPFAPETVRTELPILLDEIDHEVAGVVVATDDEGLQLSAAVASVHSNLAGSAPIVVTARHRDGLASMLAPLGRHARSFEVVALDDEACWDERITSGRLEAMARSIHAGYYRHVAATTTVEEREGNPAFCRWEDLPTRLRQQNLDAATFTWDALARLGYRLAPLRRADADAFAFSPDELTQLAEAEHRRWHEAKYPGAPVPDWSSVAPSDVAKTEAQVRGIPRMLAYAGLQLERDT